MKKVATTENYNLYIQGANEDPTFKDWAAQVAGETDSNMVKIDEALQEQKSVSLELTLLASAWAGSEAPYTQNITIEGLDAERNGVVTLSDTADASQRDVARKAILNKTGQYENGITISADGKVPTVDIPIVVILLA